MAAGTRKKNGSCLYEYLGKELPAAELLTLRDV